MWIHGSEFTNQTLPIKIKGINAGYLLLIDDSVCTEIVKVSAILQDEKDSGVIFYRKCILG